MENACRVHRSVRFSGYLIMSNGAFKILVLSHLCAYKCMQTNVSSCLLLLSAILEGLNHSLECPWGKRAFKLQMGQHQMQGDK